jgi:hypothetical protein
MTATNPTQTTCPSCGSIYVTALEAGGLFCAECRNEWDPNATPAPSTAGRQLGEPLHTEEDLIARVDALGSYQTVVSVHHDDGGSGNWRADRWVFSTAEPHDDIEAQAAARAHYEAEVGSTVESVTIVDRVTLPLPPTVETVDDDTARELEGFIASTDAESAAYLEQLVGTGITLEGGQRAVILGFGDDDAIDVQLSNGDYATVAFNDVVHADNGPADVEIVEHEIDDATAEVFGMASLLLACMVIEAGVASIEGDGADAHLVPAATGWFPEDEDAVPVMELAAAGAVAMLVQTFALPRADITAMVERIRNEALTQTNTEAQGHDEHTDDDDSTTADHEPGGES